MIIIKTPDEIKLMRKSGEITRDVLELVGEKIKPGISTFELDEIAYNYIVSCGAKPSFKGYGGFPGAICTSVDDVVVHGIPSKTEILEEGQIISLDAGAFLNGYHSDAARTFAVGKISKEKQQLMDVTKESFFRGVKNFAVGKRLGDISSAIQKYCESFGYGVVRDLVGHGVGRDLHEDPNVPNYGREGHGLRLDVGMTLAIEPMITMGTYKVYCDSDDGWTIRTNDGLPCAHYENTVALTENGIEILTL